MRHKVTIFRLRARVAQLPAQFEVRYKSDTVMVEGRPEAAVLRCRWRTPSPARLFRRGAHHRDAFMELGLPKRIVMVGGASSRQGSSTPPRAGCKRHCAPARRTDAAAVRAELAWLMEHSRHASTRVLTTVTRIERAGEEFRVQRERRAQQLFRHLVVHAAGRVPFIRRAQFHNADSAMLLANAKASPRRDKAQKHVMRRAALKDGGRSRRRIRQWTAAPTCNDWPTPPARDIELLAARWRIGWITRPVPRDVNRHDLMVRRAVSDFIATTGHRCRPCFMT